MRVMCINDKGWDNLDESNKDESGPSYGEICTVIGHHNIANTLYGYYLKEYPPDSFIDEAFVPLTGDKEPEIKEQLLLKMI